MSASGRGSAGRGIPEKGAVLRIFLRECLRVAAVPWHLLLFLPHKGRHRRRVAQLLSHQEPSTRNTANADAARDFRRALGTRLESIQHIYLACGEASGEEHAIRLAEALREAKPGLRISGMGGEALAKAGVELSDNIVDHAVMGITAVFKQLPFYFGVVGRFLRFMKQERVDLLIPIDNPGLNLVLAEAAQRADIPVLYYICPQYWAWGPWRMKRFRKAVDGAIAILPFEQGLFSEAGIPTGAAGHPMIDRLPELEAEPREATLLLLPGSRRGELDRHLLPMLDLWALFHDRHPEAKAILAQSRSKSLTIVRERIQTWERQGRVFPSLEIVEGDPLPLTGRVRASLVKSGTSCLQTALCQTPLVIVFQLQGLIEGIIAHTQILIPWIAAPNLVLGRAAFPEHIQRDPRLWSQALQELESIWEATPARTQQLQDLDIVRTRLTGPSPAHLAAHWLSPPSESKGTGKFAYLSEGAT